MKLLDLKSSVFTFFSTGNGSFPLQAHQNYTEMLAIEFASIFFCGNIVFFANKWTILMKSLQNRSWLIPTFDTKIVWKKYSYSSDWKKVAEKINLGNEIIDKNYTQK